MAKYVVAEVLWDKTLTSAGELDTNDDDDYGHSGALPIDDYLNFHVLIVTKTDDATTGNVSMYLNNDLTSANYRYWVTGSSNSSTINGNANDAFIGRSTGGSGLSGSYMRGEFTLSFPQVAGLRRTISGVSLAREDSTNTSIRVVAKEWVGSDPITRITIQSSGHPTKKLVSGSRMIVIGERTMSISTGAIARGPGNITLSTL